MKMITPRVQVNVIAAAGLAVLAILYRFPPEEHSFYPVCPLYRLTHIYCAGCGATRAVAALLHGRMAYAFHYNALLVLLLPIAMVYFFQIYWTAMRRNEFIWPRIPSAMAPGLLLAVAVFAVLRNIVFHSL